MPVIVNGTPLQCPDCGNTEQISITGSDSNRTRFTCGQCGTAATVEH